MPVPVPPSSPLGVGYWRRRGEQHPDQGCHSQPGLHPAAVAVTAVLLLLLLVLVLVLLLLLLKLVLLLILLLKRAPSACLYSPVLGPPPREWPS